MSAIIRINDPSTGTSEIWVEKPFLSIGSDLSCEIPIKGQSAGEVASLRYKEGKYLVFNTADENLTVDGVPVACGTSARWIPGKVVMFSNGAKLELVIQGDPAPVRRVTVTKFDRPVSKPAETDSTEGEDEGPAEENPTPETVKKTGGKTEIIQGIVILFCVVGCIAILTMKNQESTHGEGSTKADFANLVKSGTFASQSEDGATRERKQALVRQLQSAEFSVRRRDYALAHAKYSRLKLYMDQQSFAVRGVVSSVPAAPLEKSAAPGERAEKLLTGNEFDSALRSYVESQLAMLPAK